MDQSLIAIVDDLRRSLQSREPAPAERSTARYELFYHPNSICSQKVRAVLAYHHISYTARVVNIASGETYLPSYVRLRLIGCRSVPGPLARSHTGSTSVGASGCDAAVVPTLIDWIENEVIVDSKRICLRLDDAYSEEQRLRPASLAAQIDEEIDIVDNFPNYQLRVGRPPTGGETPVTKMGVGGQGFGMSKVARCNRYIRENLDEPALVEAYQSKLNKEQQGANELLTPVSMEKVYTTVKLALSRLERRLSDQGCDWLFSNEVTMADLFWAIQLLRIKNMCGDQFWGKGEFPMVRDYLHKVARLPSITASVTLGSGGVA